MIFRSRTPLRFFATKGRSKKIDWGDPLAFRDAPMVLYTNNGDKVIYRIAYVTAAAQMIFWLNLAHFAYTELRSEGFVSSSFAELSQASLGNSHQKKKDT